jgi:hypothetical protein
LSHNVWRLAGSVDKYPLIRSLKVGQAKIQEGNQ